MRLHNSCICANTQLTVKANLPIVFFLLSAVKSNERERERRVAFLLKIYTLTCHKLQISKKCVVNIRSLRFRFNNNNTVS